MQAGDSPPGAESAERLDRYHPLDPVGAFEVYPKLRQLRRSCPVLRTTNEDYPPVTFFTRYADVTAVLRDYKTFRNVGTDVVAEDYEKIPPDERNLTQLNPPEHTEVRRLVLEAISPKVVKRVVPRVEALGNQVVGRFKARGRAELVSEWAAVFPGLATAYVLGLPEQDAAQIHEWVSAQLSDELLKTREATGDKRFHIDLGEWFEDYLRAQLELRREGTITTQDGITRMMQYKPKGRDAFSDEELVRQIHGIIVAANETTTGLMSNVVWRILATPGLFERLRDDRALLDPVIEEAARFDPPVLFAIRGCQKEASVAGVDLHPGDGVTLSLASANRDEAIWGDDADEFNPERFVEQPGHEIMTFGLGVHFCPGAHLARLETRIGLNALLDHTHNMHLAEDFTYEKVWFYLIHRPKEVHVEFEPTY